MCSLSEMQSERFVPRDAQTRDLPKGRTLRVDLFDDGYGRAKMMFGPEKIGVSREPLFVAARILLDRGLAWPRDTIELWRDGERVVHGLVGQAAQCTVEDGRVTKVNPKMNRRHASLHRDRR